MTWQEDAEVVRGGLGKTPTAIGAIAERHEALDRLIAELEAAEERLTAYETPGWINSVQKVMEERARAEKAEQRIVELEAIIALPPCNNIECTRTDHLAGAARAALGKK